jgi:hypothetical protein
MPAESDNQENRFDHSLWVLITQCLLREESHDEKSGAKTVAGSLFQAMRELGFAPDGFEKLEETIVGIIGTARRHALLGGKPDWLVHIRLFCQRILLDGLPRYEEQQLGGWGYYTIERGEDSTALVCDCYHRIIEFYIYREGVDAI